MQPARTTERPRRLAATAFAVAFVVIMSAAIVVGGIFADRVPAWGWPILGLSIMLVGMCLLARESGR